MMSSAPFPPSNPPGRPETVVLEAGQTVQVRRPTARFMFGHPARILALGFGSGLSPILPGTVGTLYAWLIYVVFALDFGADLAADRRGWLRDRHLGMHPHRTRSGRGRSWRHGVGRDGRVLARAGLRHAHHAGGQFAAFLWFRFFDMVKPAPIRYYDRTLKGFGVRGGYGVMVDDILAAFYTLLVFALWRSF